MFSTFFVSSTTFIEALLRLRGARAMLQQVLRVPADRHQRVPHLVGDPGREPPHGRQLFGPERLLLGAAQAFLRLQDPLDHPVEGGGELPHLVPLDAFDAQRVIPRRDLLGGGRKLADGGDHGPVEKDPPEEDEDGDVDRGQKQRDVHQGPHLGGDPGGMEADPDAAGYGRGGGCHGRRERAERKDHVHGGIHREERERLLAHGDDLWTTLGRRFRQQDDLVDVGGEGPGKHPGGEARGPRVRRDLLFHRPPDDPGDGDAGLHMATLHGDLDHLQREDGEEGKGSGGHQRELQHEAGADRERAPQQAHGKGIDVDSALTRDRIAKTDEGGEFGRGRGSSSHEDRGPAIPAGARRAAPPGAHDPLRGWVSSLRSPRRTTSSPRRTT